MKRVSASIFWVAMNLFGLLDRVVHELGRGELGVRFGHGGGQALQVGDLRRRQLGGILRRLVDQLLLVLEPCRGLGVQPDRQRLGLLERGILLRRFDGLGVGVRTGRLRGGIAHALAAEVFVHAERRRHHGKLLPPRDFVLVLHLRLVGEILRPLGHAIHGGAS
jgi:hypothetical protein